MAAAGRITGQTAVVVGGSRGIGLGLVRKLLDRDNRVIATARKPAEAVQLKELGQQYGGKLQVTALDMSEPASVTAWAQSLKEQQGVGHIDVLVNSAGVYGNRRGALAEWTPEDFTEVFKTNTLGPFMVVQQLHKQGLLGPPRSLVVNVTTIMASHGDPTVSGVTPGGYAYRASKGALNIVNKALSLELAKDKVEFVLIHPGYVQTDMTGGQGWVTVEESTTGIMSVLETKYPLNDKWYAFNGDEVPY
eukprot:CAMPEP_0202857610 /NCGR_PEP_ID=MMETSP1391-20130828/485_1 /ASSEMBLY_ACC=CAM_ASM_000867 /TAXON_ID=1034604 /ORGANISM="Chlamydomonas leiostraca, Strain SAG 11-49" /LENGTH=247 /DNA_ID=CAMNT_0049536429 /DNA_START=124 /DNA_END=867 /DNA_ORIENTATION=-